MAATNESQEKNQEMQRPDWGVMAYLAGDNELANEMVRALKQIESRYETGADRNGGGEGSVPIRPVAVQFDPSGAGLPTQRYYFGEKQLTQETEPVETTTLLEAYRQKLPKPDAEEFNETNTGNPAALSGFVHWAMTDPNLGASEADNYALVLSGHGSGATEEVFLRDHSPEDALSVRELDKALDNARHMVYIAKNWQGSEPLTAERLRKELDWRIDPETREDPEEKKKRPRLPPRSTRLALLGLDACFMNMAEVCYDIRDHADYVVGAQGFEPAFGWPYDRIIRGAQAESDLTAGKLAEIIVKEYVDYYSDFDKTAGCSVDLAAIKTGSLEDLVTPLKSLAGALQNALDYPALRDQIVLAHWKAQRYKFEQYVDLYDLCECLSLRFLSKDLPSRGLIYDRPDNNTEAPPVGDVKDQIVKACKAVKEAVEECVLVSRCSGYAYQHSRGLSIYFPWAKMPLPHAYTHFRLVQETNWGNFLDDYLEKTCREPRSGFEPSEWMERKTEVDKCAAGCLDKLDAFGNKYGRRVTKYGRRVTKYGRRVTKYGRRVTKYAGDRDTSVTNFPLVYGQAEWRPPKRKKKGGGEAAK